MGRKKYGTSLLTNKRLKEAQEAINTLIEAKLEGCVNPLDIETTEKIMESYGDPTKMASYINIPVNKIKEALKWRQE